MNQNQSQTKKRAELKNAARELLRGKYAYVILTLLLVSFLSSGINATSYFLFVPENLLGNILYYSSNILLSSLSGIFSIGVSYFFLNICCGQKFHFMDIFYGFVYHPSKSFLLSFMFSILNLICNLPLLFVDLSSDTLNMIQYTKQLGLLLLVSLLCNVLYTLATLLFSQCYFLLLDFPELSFKELLLHSIMLMKGNIMRYLLLLLSFIPMQLLALGSCGIGYLWVTPYMQATYTLFYLDIVRNKNLSQS